ncbi:hypothetical protein ERJ75_001188800 [Trypanosoma vivax]|nr:hypothetical protein ERJ75_001188800 [Trypanosoma vivax]
MVIYERSRGEDGKVVERGMCRLTLDPTHMRTTSTFDIVPGGARGSFRPRLPFVSALEKRKLQPLAPRDKTCVNLGVIRDEVLRAGQTPIARWSSCRQRETSALERSIYWLVYEEEQMRKLLLTTAFINSPLQCYYTHEEVNDYVRLCSWSYDPPLALRDEDITEMTGAALDNLFQRIKLEVVAPVRNRGQCTGSRGSVLTLLQNSCSVDGAFREYLEGKKQIEMEYMRQLETWKELIELVAEEKEARVSLLGQFISCQCPVPCNCLLWDIEVLEESAIPLEPAVQITCLFVSIVITERTTLENDLLEERRCELMKMDAQRRLLITAFDTLDNIRKEETKRFTSLLDFHNFSVNMKHKFSEREDIPRKEGQSHSVWCILQRKHKRFCMNYYEYLQTVEYMNVETDARARLEARRLRDFCYIFFNFEFAHRVYIGVEEEQCRQAVVMGVEATRRRSVEELEAIELGRDICPFSFLTEMDKLVRDSRSRHFYETFFAPMMMLLSEQLHEFEQQRRATIRLFETQMRINLQLLFVRTTEGISKRVVARWTFEHQMQNILNNELRMRVRIEKLESEALASHAVAHQWMVEYGWRVSRTVQERGFQCVVDALLDEETSQRHRIECRRAEEHRLLFGTKLCVPNRNGIMPEGSGAECSVNSRSTSAMTASSNMDICQEVIADLSVFFDNKTLLDIFGPGDTAIDSSQST